ncbi:odorant receptor 131-2-like [Corythoichthys intestinalis]|uniref:odorant receptor 131-2-like n=1 Tax=Corythoichthys intestinalis TaxID=161448 RepID=UPI0025A659CA|nr:odorant receptor 131-2-like [Corythoichthys intestinalis]XP_061801272.1 odorant receptor 131-2-like [Nerophis lumbriciformis]
MQPFLLSNATVRVGFVERITTITLTCAFCSIIFFVNGTMLFTLRSKGVFRETARYILLFNLLLVDTLQLSISQLMFCLNAFHVTLSYPVCVLLALFANLLTRMSPVLLVAMSLERYVAVCHPLRHASVTTVRNTAVVVYALWSFCFFNVVIQAFLFVYYFPFGQLESLQMTQLCSYKLLLLVSAGQIHHTVSTFFVFISAGLSIIFSYVAVIIVARSMATNKDSSTKARNTLLLHLFQLGLCLLSVLYTILLTRIATFFEWLDFMRLQCFLFICFILMPRGLGSLVYGLRDQSLRVPFLYHLCCHVALSVASD